MREIKFRAWVKNEKSYVEISGFEVNQKTGEMDCVYLDGEPYGRAAVILEQFTGLYSKSGQEIYEGDIVKWGHIKGWSEENPVRIAEVKICPDIQFHSQVGVFRAAQFSYFDDTDKYLEVIGNVWENKELFNDNTQTKKD